MRKTLLSDDAPEQIRVEAEDAGSTSDLIDISDESVTSRSDKRRTARVYSCVTLTRKEAEFVRDALDEWLDGKVSSASSLLRARDLATLCKVDPKSISNWCAKGTAPAHLRTPGGQFRFRVADVAPWLAKHGYEVPATWKELLAAEET